MQFSNNSDNVSDSGFTINPKATDAGEDTQSNYRFQNLCTSLIALNMYRGETEYVEIFCELYEDIVTVKKNNHFVGIQIKHKDKKYGVHSIIGEPILKSIKRFVEHEKNYPKKFDKFIIISNVEISIGQNKLINELSTYCQNRRKQKKTEMESILFKIRNKIKFNENDIADVLSKTESEKVPDREYLVDNIANNCACRIPECKNKNTHQLKELVNTIADIVYRKSTTIDDSLQEYFAFKDNSQVKRNYAKINHKRITKEEVKTIISKSEKIVLLDSDIDWPKKIGSFDLIDAKMALGGVHTSAIYSMKNLTVNAFNYFFKRQHEEESEGKGMESGSTILKHVVGILDEQSAQAETSARLEGTPFGLKKLQILDKKLEEISKDRSKDVYCLSPEILKGIVGLRVTECKVNFSDEPMEGFV